ncbi:hypothetical protein GMA3_49 [Gordonia phage GMA3]|uniref:Uncharacterized protein n=1 Tax=Gordonia phage GMA3 TaxID=1647284 RepID=A0A0K0NKJ8_9CAUD|nr:hypothetical protein AU105_gp049 [Gordonia phage GMA3]AKL88226.1 hypothetical protein GMA3_49 [Gordonia phage GMA3]
MVKELNPVSFVGPADTDKSDENFKDFTIRSNDEAPKGSSVPESVNDSPDDQSQLSSPIKSADRMDSTGGEKSPLTPPISPLVPSTKNASAEKG